jgi:hypothetical protein
MDNLSFYIQRLAINYYFTTFKLVNFKFSKVKFEAFNLRLGDFVICYRFNDFWQETDTLTHRMGKPTWCDFRKPVPKEWLTHRAIILSEMDISWHKNYPTPLMFMDDIEQFLSIEIPKDLRLPDPSIR